MTKGKKCLMEVWKTRDDGAAVSATAHHQDADWPLQQLRIGQDNRFGEPMEHLGVGVAVGRPGLI
jgi:hypothetical protein